MKLYEIDRALETCVIIDENGEEVALDFDAIRLLEMERDKKLENLCCMYKGMIADIAALKSEKKKLGDRQSALEKRAESLLEFLQAELAGEIVKSARVQTTYRNVKDIVEITDEKLLPEEALRVKTEPDKTAIKQLIKSGVPVPGAVLFDRISMSIK